jgi:hypothetical protein
MKRFAFHIHTPSDNEASFIYFAGNSFVTVTRKVFLCVVVCNIADVVTALQVYAYQRAIISFLVETFSETGFRSFAALRDTRRCETDMKSSSV